MIKQVTIPGEKQKLNLTADKRIRHDAIRVLRTMKPYIGMMYADSRSKGVRYKVRQTGMTIPQMDRLTSLLNAVYMKNRINAKAYLHQEQGRASFWTDITICVFVKYQSK